MISIIIPTYNEADTIAVLLQYLQEQRKQAPTEIIVVDGGSQDTTVAIAQSEGAISVISPEKGRAAQMNYGATLAKGNILYFVHADTFPPPTFIDDINDAIASGVGFGRYRTQFDSDKIILKLNAFFTRFDLFVCYGGDQTLFMNKTLFHSIGGFNSTMRIMEDYDIVMRAKQKAKYKIIQKNALISARKYATNSWFKVQFANYTIVKMFKNGATQQQMTEKYKALLAYR
ncbi:TIGR04283 family arsenosugar biosynthesis glycosyltransferase [Parasediminibacterium paludis]|uniref:TIGR04283 family arsenosugar biosynthesis glycosyltransferase n=1 Tax=Parasediminibacterium paludis TaxID=908966 RepID=A0ABV8PQA8_9BACT